MAHTSERELLALHAVRLLGFADEARVAARYALDRSALREDLLDYQAQGMVTRTEFAGSRGWSLTHRGRIAGEAALAAELDACCGRGTAVATLAQFLPLNDRFQEATTRWQVRPVAGDPLSANDHTDFRWDDRVVADLEAVAAALGPVCAPLCAVLSRFAGYDRRLAAAVGRVAAGQHRWLDAVGIDSAQVVWMQLHEDLLATLGRQRGDPGA